ncbi:MAG TPA: methyl-accepting chemotaxis protein [Ferrovibrio sp.]|uniref:methyl-accepting chemotaxis protein n=1 Tax=Ferrovibrio sp. TaxID=1917215 RepID=UPI002B4B9370|nr:methyl-accepting chemotaxis protein [Ferrovibrio sp.]HLT76958.1 methyl-accepting chemotaxis protein [Ferrovibrio sp.]
MTTALLRLESLDDLRRRASGAFAVWLWLHLPLILAVAWFNGTGLLASGIGALVIAAIATWFCRRDAAGAATRQVVAAAFVGMASLLVFAASGPWQIDLHMYYFAIFAVLAAYCDWRAILTAATLTALHHLVLNFALPYAIFPDGSDFGRVIVHAVIVVAECAVLIWLCLVLENLFARSAQSLSDMQVSMADRERLEADAAAERERFAAERAAQEARFEQAIGHVVAAAADGDLGQRVATGELSGVMQRVGMTVNTLLERTETVIGAAQDVTAAMAKGDLRRRVATGFQGRFGALADDINSMGDRLRDFTARLAGSADAVQAASTEISSGSQDLSARTESQAASIEETAASMHEITETVKQNAGNAQAASQLAMTARDTAEKGGGVVGDTVTAMHRIEDSARRISDIVMLIDEIAFQTNLLALNASVEAARAGEAGKGFAVVAQEVRALAQRSASASKDIKTLISESNAQVKAGAALVNQAGQSLAEIVAAVKKVSDIVGEIAAASHEQATGLDQVNTAVAAMDEVTQRNSALVEETTAAAQTLAAQSRELAGLVSFFRT